MSVPYLRLTDSNNNVYNFPASFWLTDNGYSTTQEIKNIAYAPGGKNTADGFLEARTIMIEGELRADTLAALETLERALQKAINKGGRLSVSDDTVSRYITVGLPKVSSRYTNDYRTEKYFAISYIAEYPFWEDATETEDSNVVAGNTSLTIDNSASDFLVSPIIEISADQSVAVPSVKMINKSDGAMTFEYNDPYFVAGDVVEIDCRNGTVKRNSNSTIEYFSPARFLRLQNLSNTIDYEGAACTITFKYRKVYL